MTKMQQFYTFFLQELQQLLGPQPVCAKITKKVSFSLFSL